MLPKLVITDIDGVWTDGGMYYTAEGDVMKRFSVKDGWGVIFLRELDIPVAIMTGENTQIVQKRADKLKIDYCYLGVKDKVAQAEELCRELGISLSEVAFIGDDLNDFATVASGGLQRLSQQYARICEAGSKVCNGCTWRLWSFSRVCGEAAER